MDAFTKRVLPSAQRGQCNDQFGQVTQRGVEQTADRIARLGRDGFGGVAQQRGQRHDSQDGQHKKKRMRFWLDFVSDEYHGHEGQQPEQGIVTDFLKQEVHGGSLRSNGISVFSQFGPTTNCCEARASRY